MLLTKRQYSFTYNHYRGLANLPQRLRDLLTSGNDNMSWAGYVLRLS